MSKAAQQDPNNVVPWVFVETPAFGENAGDVLESFCLDSEASAEKWMLALRHFQSCDIKIIDEPASVKA